MYIILFTLVFCVGFSRVRSETPAPQCEASSRPSAPIKVFLSGLRNRTGHLISQVAVQQKISLEGLISNRTHDEWLLDVEHSSSLCAGTEAIINVVLTFTAATLRPTPIPTLLPGYTLLPGLGYYKFHTTSNTWPLARQTCIDEGAHLAVINSQKEADALKTFSSVGEAWIGIYEQWTDGNYLTVLGEPATSALTGFMTWHPGEPNDKSVGNCLLFNKSPGGYNDYLCGQKFSFICEQ